MGTKLPAVTDNRSGSLDEFCFEARGQTDPGSVTKGCNKPNQCKDQDQQGKGPVVTSWREPGKNSKE